jgi:hypothetical protein
MIMSNLLVNYRPKSVFELGSQYLYDTGENCSAAVSGTPVYGKSWFESKGIKHTSIDLNDEADIKADIINNTLTQKYDWVTDFGTTEHTKDAFTAFKNIHDWTEVGGLMIHVNPEVGSWPNHGEWWFTEDLYPALAEACGYKLLHVERAAAMGNIQDGWDVYSVLEKIDGSTFSISKKDFYKHIKGRNE